MLVNAATPAEVRAGLAAGAEGAGLIRTELAFLDAPAWPRRSAARAACSRPLLAGLDGRTATVRVLDFGGDKIPPFLHGEPRRGIELLLAHPGRAARPARPRSRGLARDARAARAAPDGDGRPSEVARHVARSSPRSGAEVALGAMIELPEAAEAAAEIAADVDFLSIGTNDLTHATLGTDRFAHGEAPAHDPRVLAHIAAHGEARRGRPEIPLEVCGEAASDPLTVPLLVGLGADELSAGAARVGSRARLGAGARPRPRPQSAGRAGRSRRRDAAAVERAGCSRCVSR